MQEPFLNNLQPIHNTITPLPQNFWRSQTKFDWLLPYNHPHTFSPSRPFSTTSTKALAFLYNTKPLSLCYIYPNITPLSTHLPVLLYLKFLKIPFIIVCFVSSIASLTTRFLFRTCYLYSCPLYCQLPMSVARTSSRKIRPYTPFVTRRRSLSPPPDIDIGFNSTPLPSSSGMFLLVHNVLPSTDKKAGFGRPVELVQKA